VNPNLVALGLLTGPTERQYRKLGMMVSGRGEAAKGLELVAN